MSHDRVSNHLAYPGPAPRERGEASEEETMDFSGALGKLTTQDMLAREGYKTVF